MTIKLGEITDLAKSDQKLLSLLTEAREYACVYVLARQRQKGCDGMGELVTMKEEFRDIINKMIQYSQERQYIPGDVSYDLDSIVDEIAGIQDQL
jgi:hypothetical protein